MTWVHDERCCWIPAVSSHWLRASSCALLLSSHHLITSKKLHNVERHIPKFSLRVAYCFDVFEKRAFDQRGVCHVKVVKVVKVVGVVREAVKWRSDQRLTLFPVGISATNLMFLFRSSGVIPCAVAVSRVFRTREYSPLAIFVILHHAVYPAHQNKRRRR